MVTQLELGDYVPAAPVALADWPIGERSQLVIEAPSTVDRIQPSFVLDLSGFGMGLKMWPRQEIHGTDLTVANQVVVFGQNNIVNRDGLWACESGSFKSQFLDTFVSPTFNAIHPGRKPTIEKTEDKFIASFSRSLDDYHLLPDRVFLATPLEPDNWGRWVNTVIPKAIQYATYGDGAPFFCRSKLPWQRAFLSFLGVSSEVLLDHEPGSTYLCPQAISTEYSAADFTISRMERAGYLKIAHRCLANQPRVSGDRLFVSRLSRSRRNPDYRVLQNEQDLIDALSLVGFTAVEPELLPIEQQIAAFARAKYIVALGGAGVFNCVFCDIKTKVISIEATNQFIPAHSSLLSSVGLEHAVIFGRSDTDDPTPVHKRWTLDIPRAIPAIMEFFGPT